MTKKDRERFYLERAQQVYHEFPSGTPDDSEVPDFLWKTPAGPLGVEVVDYIRGFSSASITMRTLDSLHSQVSAYARDRFEVEHQIPLRVHLHWNDSFKFTRGQVTALGADLASVVAANIPFAPYERVVLGYDTGDEQIFDAIYRVSITRLRDGASGLWAAVEAGFIEVTALDLQVVVEQKDAKVASYLRRCSEVWLLIVADGRHISSTVEFTQEKEMIIRTRFARVLLYDGFTHSVIRLK